MAYHPATSTMEETLSMHSHCAPSYSRSCTTTQLPPLPDLHHCYQTAVAATGHRRYPAAIAAQLLLRLPGRHPYPTAVTTRH